MTVKEERPINLFKMDVSETADVGCKIAKRRKEKRGRKGKKDNSQLLKFGIFNTTRVTKRVQKFEIFGKCQCFSHYL